MTLQNTGKGGNFSAALPRGDLWPAYAASVQSLCSHKKPSHQQQRLPETLHCQQVWGLDF